MFPTTFSESFVPIGLFTFQILFFVVAAIVLIIILSKSFKNNKSPRLTVPAKAVTKRADMRHSFDGPGCTTYYVTFEVESGDRMELQVMDHEYGMIAEGDTGKLSFQGTRFLSFNRES